MFDLTLMIARNSVPVGRFSIGKFENRERQSVTNAERSSHSGERRSEGKILTVAILGSLLGKQPSLSVPVCSTQTQPEPSHIARARKIDSHVVC